MQILLFVLTVLMLLSLLTYARLDSYISFILTRNQFEKYMSKTEREFFNLRNIKWYNDTPATSKEENKGGGTSGTSKISLFPIINKEAKDKDFDLYSQVRYVFKSLIEELYGNTRFYRDAANNRPSIVDDLLSALESKAQGLPKGQKLTDSKDLANLDLGDKQLDEFFYKVLKGAKKEDSEKEAIDKIKNDTDVDHEPDTEEGYLSLLDFITLDPRSKLRVYLAPKRTLLAITKDPDLVTEILQQRIALFKQVDANLIKPEDASKQFEHQFSTRISSLVNQHLLDYTVTKTDPKTYE